MGSLRAELIKLRRSSSWVVVAGLPMMAVATGAANTVFARGLEDGWHTLWLRTVVFHGLFPLAVGVAVLSSLVWRVEHRGGNWNALMSRGVSSRDVVTSKVMVIVALTAAMQVALLLGVIVVGKVMFGLPGMIPFRYVLACGVIVVASIPVAALQCGLSMLVASFAAPVAMAVVGAGAAVALLLARIDLAVPLVPYAVLGRATRLGTGTFDDDGTISAGAVIVIVVCAVIVGAVITIVSVVAVDRRDIR